MGQELSRARQSSQSRRSKGYTTISPGPSTGATISPGIAISRSRAPGRRLPAPTDLGRHGVDRDVSGHGNTAGFLFGIADKDNGNTAPTEMRLGNKNLEWLILDACNVLERDNLNVFNR